MLNKIKNIEPGSDYRKAGKFKIFESTSRLIESSINNISDSKQLSPALKFLAENNWKLSNLKFNNKESLLVTLKIGNYEITSLIDVLGFSDLEYFEYDIKTCFDETDRKLNYVAKFKSQIDDKKVFSDYRGLNLNPLDILFNRFISLNINNEINKRDTTLISSLISDKQKEIEILFDYINKIFLTFVRKLTHLHKIEKIGVQNYSDQSVILISIKPFST